MIPNFTCSTNLRVLFLFFIYGVSLWNVVPCNVTALYTPKYVRTLRALLIACLLKRRLKKSYLTHKYTTLGKCRYFRFAGI
jgi:hypothetical protein